MLLEGEEKIQDALAPGIQKVGDHRSIPFFRDQSAVLDPAHMFAGRGALEPALFGDFLKREAGLRTDYLQNPDAVVMGKRFGDQGQPREWVRFMNQFHNGLNSKK